MIQYNLHWHRCRCQWAILVGKLLPELEAYTTENLERQAAESDAPKVARGIFPVENILTNKEYVHMVIDGIRSRHVEDGMWTEFRLVANVLKLLAQIAPPQPQP